MRKSLIILLVSINCCSGRRSEPGDVSSDAAMDSGMGVEETTGFPPPTSTSNSSSSSSSSSGSTGEQSTSTSTGSDLTTSGPDIPPAGCGPFEPNCPVGMKCNAYGSQSRSGWNDSKCVPIVDDPDQVGEKCKIFADLYSGEDSCEAGAMCWDAAADTLEGICVPQCTGNSLEPICTAPHSFCFQAGPLALCLPKCSPFLGCDVGVVCDRDPNDPGGFTCAPDLPGGALFGSCDGPPGTCDAGLTCLAPESAFECDQGSPGCCVPFCRVGEMNGCPGVGQECQPLYGDPELEAPPLFWALGICAVPP